MKNQTGTMKNHEEPWRPNLEPWKTMKTDLEVEVEVDLRPLRKVIIFRDKQNLPIIYRSSKVCVDKLDSYNADASYHGIQRKSLAYSSHWSHMQACHCVHKQGRSNQIN